VFFERRDQITTLFRFPVELEWRLGGARLELFDPVTRRATRRDRPDAVKVRVAEDDDGDPAVVSIDRHLLQDTLGLLDEELAELEAGWREDPDAAAIAGRLLRFLTPKGGAARPASPGDLLGDLVQAVRLRLPAGVSVYPTGIVQDASLIFATHHLQRELAELASLPLRSGDALWSYLTGAPGDEARAPVRGRFRARGLTASQRAAAEVALGSRLAAVQGPPGTGKTELILSLAAHALVERIEGWCESRSMDGGLLVVASTNNRAVDNVIDPLGSQIEDGRLPLALRTGSQEVTRTITARELARALHWLSGRGDAGALDQLDEARAAFRRASEALRELTGTQEARMRRDARARAVRRDLEALPPAPGAAPELDALHEGLRALRAATSTLARSARTRRTKAPRLEARWRRVAADLVAPLLPLRPHLATALAMPSPTADRAAWREALDDALEEIDEALAPLGGEDRGRIERRRDALERELSELEPAPAEPPPDAGTEREIEIRAHAAFLRALEVRERWAIGNRTALVAALDRAANAATKAGSIRQALESDSRGTGPGLRALYPVMGCTLLSFGNVFRHGAGEIDALVIDEAGQCHPAYPVSAIGRARRALLIGDVHQLPPVVTLSERDEARVRRRAGVDIAGRRFDPFLIHDRAGTSAQALADRAVRERKTLTDHFRCQREIIGLSDELCGYGLTVHTPARSRAATLARLAAPVLFEAVRGEQVRARGSWSNLAEAEGLVDLVSQLRAAGVSLVEVGVLTPYLGQLELLRQLLRRRGIPIAAARDELDPAPNGGRRDLLSIGTVHRFQGGERSVILVSTAITRDHDLAFIDERANLLNVAISRAREHLVTFGCEEVLRRGRHTRLLVERAERLP
jgi:hypothetical protein